MDLKQGSTTESILHTSGTLFNQLVTVFQDCIKHDATTQSIMTCSFITLSKNILKNPGNTANYIAIIGSLLILKYFKPVF